MAGSLVTRRAFLVHTARAVAAGTAGLALPARAGQAPGAIRREGRRPGIPYGVQAGDVADGAAIVWSRTDRPARMLVEWSTTESFQDPRRLRGPAALDVTDYTARVDLMDLPAGQRIFYRVQFEDLSELGVLSEPVTGSFRTPSAAPSEVRFAWSGDVCGQGWGIDVDRGGMRTWEMMRRTEPHFFLHSGDTIYADNPLQAEVKLDDGTVWRNRVTPEKSKVAETLAEFRGNHAYNLLDDNLRRFNAEVPLLVQWDDHEVLNNWFPGKRMDTDSRYTVKSCDLLAARARRAFLEYFPLRYDPRDPERIYRAYRHGPLCEVFLVDARSYRGRNTRNDQETPGPDTAFFGPSQVEWLKRRLAASRATWKVLACDMPLGLIVGDGPNSFEAVANGNGPARGRELEIADLLRFIRDRNIRNVVWLTADVHYAAAHYYDPNRARFQEFLPFWEFVAGPLHAGNFGPGRLDDTFGPEVRFHSVSRGTRSNRPPSDGHQYFGTVRIDPGTRVLTVRLHNVAGSVLFTQALNPEP